jgi:hypothetical protein
MSVRYFRSSLFDDPDIFPLGTCLLDSALVMRNLPVRWVAEPPSILPPAIKVHASDL